MSVWLLVVLLIAPDGRLDLAGYAFDDKRQCEEGVARAAEHFGAHFLAARCELRTST